MKVLTLDDFKNWALQKDFKLYLYSVLILVFTIFCLLIFLGISNPDLFNIAKRYFILDVSNLNTNIILSSYTHTNLTHLKENVLSYVILFLLVFHLVDDKKKIKQLMLLSLIVFPIANSLFLALFTDTKAGGGLSGINACLNGYLFFAISYNLQKTSSYPVKKYTILMVIIFNLLVATFFISKNLVFILSAFILISFLFYVNRRTLFEARLYLLKNLKEKSEICIKYISMWVFALLFMISSFRMLAPVFSSELNIEYSVHYFGWFYGLILSWLILD